MLSSLATLSAGAVVGLPFLAGWRSPRTFDRINNFYNFAITGCLLVEVGWVTGSALMKARVKDLRPNDTDLAESLDAIILGEPYTVWLPLVGLGYMAAMAAFDILVVRPSLEDQAAKRHRDPRRDNNDG